jgi:hypothetical protein
MAEVLEREHARGPGPAPAELLQLAAVVDGTRVDAGRGGQHGDDGESDKGGEEIHALTVRA